jgi:MFS family permease
VIVRLDRDFGKLWTAAAVSTLGDGITATAGPLLAATLTRDPLLIGVVGAASFAPWLLVGLVSGALVDRLDRRRVLWTVDLARAAVLAALAVAVLAGGASIPLLAGGAFLLGVGQTLFDSAAQASIPSLVGRAPDRLATANGRLLGAQTVSQHFVGPPAGARCSRWRPGCRTRRTRCPSSAARCCSPASAAGSWWTGPGRRGPSGPTSPRACAGWCGTGCCAGWRC